MQGDKHALIEKYAVAAFKNKDSQIPVCVWRQHFVEFADKLDSLSAQLLGSHPDDLAVDRFAIAMKAKLAQKRAEGRGGWDNPNECSVEWLSELLKRHVEKGDPTDVGNFAMMIHQRGGRIAR